MPQRQATTSKVTVPLPNPSTVSTVSAPTVGAFGRCLSFRGGGLSVRQCLRYLTPRVRALTLVATSGHSLTLPYHQKRLFPCSDLRLTLPLTTHFHIALSALTVNVCTGCLSGGVIGTHSRWDLVCESKRCSGYAYLLGAIGH